MTGVFPVYDEDIFSNNMDKLELSDLATIYNKSAEVAKENDDITALRNAAILINSTNKH